MALEEGFDLASVPDPTDPENMLRRSGRGLYLIGTFMDRVSHNEKENARPQDLAAGCNVLLHAMLDRAGVV